jgi:hypothetical protein
MDKLESNSLVVLEAMPGKDTKEQNNIKKKAPNPKNQLPLT